MVDTRAITMQIKVRQQDYGAARVFIDDLLKQENISKEVANEVIIVFEALFQKLLDAGLDEDTQVEISRARRIGGTKLKVEFAGEPFNLYSDDEFSIEDKVLRGYEDKLDCSYRSGYNIISISISGNYRKRVFACLIAAALAIITYIPLHFLVDASGRVTLLDSFVFPLETAYANAALMVGAPMVFFSLLKNLTDTYVVSHRRSGIRQLQVRTLVTSVVAIVLAIAAGFLWSIPFADFAGMESIYSSSGFDRSFSDVVTEAVPPSIFQPFESISPIPLMLVALLVTYALCSAGKHFNALRGAMEACYTLFSRMLYVVTAALPLFCYLAILDVLLEGGFWGILEILGLLLVVYTSLVLVFISYAVRLRAHKIKVIPFTRKLMPLVRENLKIGSVIDATPFNVRYCAKNFGMNRERLERNLPVLAQINLDGNCFIITLASLLFLFLTNTHFAWFNIFSLGFLVLLLSLGAPNQPGSVLVGILIVTMYLHSFDVICFAIYFEAFVGGIQNIVNAIGDIVIVAIEEDIGSRSKPEE